ncbi:MAG: DUF4360 domain-containing protein [Myxococcota bacterium]
MMFRSYLFCALATSCLLHAGIEPLEVVDLTQSADCGELNHEVNVDPNDSAIQCLRVYFKSFAIEALNLQAPQRNCHLTAKIKIPAGAQFQATEAIAEGAYLMGPSSKGGISLTYELPQAGAIGSWIEAFRPNTKGDFNFTAKVNSSNFTQCQTQDTEIVLSSDIHMFIDSLAAGTSLISLDESGKRLSWNWKLKSCDPDYFGAAEFQSYYKAPDGRTYQARIKLVGLKGEYQSSAGFTGQLNDLKRSEGGKLLEGAWTASGARGNFQWRMIDTKSGRFNGSWTDTSGRAGQWWGEYL